MLLRCVECGQEFVWEAGEQDYYRMRGFAQPKRCPLCRKWKKFRNETRELERELAREE
jgi:hypothetical protein